MKENKTMLVISVETRDRAKVAAAIKRERLQDYVERVLNTENAKILKAGK